jgi:hypothetical protein
MLVKESRSIVARTAVGALFAILVAFTAAACNNHNLVPAGAASPAAGTAAAASGGGSASGGGGLQTPRMWGFNVNEVLPAGNINGAWFFLDLHVPVAASATAAFLVNGQPAATQPALIPLGKQGFLIDAAGVFPNDPPVALQVNDKVQFLLLNAPNQGYITNAVIVKAGPFIPGNTGASSPGPAFKAITPANGNKKAPRSTVFSFGDAVQFVTYGLLVLQFDSTGALLDPTQGQDAFPISVELRANIQYTAGQANINASSVAHDEVLMPSAGSYAWNVMALDIDGWAVGTTVDVAGFPSGGQAAATWPIFNTQ